MGAVHTFDAATSGEHDNHEWWPAWYRRAFPGYVSHDIVTDRALQKAGVDHRLHLEGGAEYLVDVKCRCRQKTYSNDLLFEVWSNVERKVPGWARKPARTHYLAYVWPQFGTGLLVPFALLQRAWDQNKHQWKADALQVVNADNGTYTTRNVAIPLDRLRADLFAAMTVYFDDGQEPFA